MKDIILRRGSISTGSRERFDYLQSEDERQIEITVKLIIDKKRVRGKRVIEKARENNILVLSEYLKEVDESRSKAKK